MAEAETAEDAMAEVGEADLEVAEEVGSAEETAALRLHRPS